MKISSHYGIIFPFLLLILTGCNQYDCMDISDASEIQFWATGTDSFNEENEGYTDDYCFNQKFLCTQERRFQGLDEDGIVKDYWLLGFDEEGNELFNGQYASSYDDSFTDLPPLSEYYNVDGGGVDWVTGATPTVTLPISNISDPLRVPFTLPAGTYNFGLTTSGLGLATLTVYFRQGATIVAQKSAGSNFDITLSSDIDNIQFIATRLPIFGPSSVVTISSFTISVFTPQPPFPITYSLALIPSYESMCDKKIQFKIFDGPDPDVDTELYHSDFVEFVSVWANGPASGRVNIRYRSIQNFAGLMYDNTSSYFSIDLEGRFRKEKLITTQKTLELTEMLLNTAASVKRQRKLTINDVPDYMHTKINLILAHAASGSVMINNKEWSLEEGYEEGDRPETYPLTPAEIWLTEKAFYKHNVI